MESEVRSAVSRSVSRQGSLRRGQQSGLATIPITLSVSLQELRAGAGDAQEEVA